MNQMNAQNLSIDRPGAPSEMLIFALRVVPFIACPVVDTLPTPGEPEVQPGWKLCRACDAALTSRDQALPGGSR